MGGIYMVPPRMDRKEQSKLEGWKIFIVIICPVISLLVLAAVLGHKLGTKAGYQDIARIMKQHGKEVPDEIKKHL